MLNLKQAIAEDILTGIQGAFPAFASAFAKASMDKKASAGKSDFEVVVKQPENPEHGDYASPVALALTKLVKKAPMDVVTEIVKHMPKKEYIGKIDAAAPGFLNIRLNPGWMQARLDDLIEQDLGHEIALGRGKSVNLEFISANPTGPMTMGNARPAFAADTLANVMECAGYAVTREFYINDAGVQVKRLGESVLRRILQAKGIEVDFPEVLYQGEYVKDLASIVAERYVEDEGKTFTLSDLEDKELLEKISYETVGLAHAANEKATHEVLKVEMDVWTSEQAIRESGAIEEVIDKLRKKGATYIKDGAEWLKATEYGHDKDVVLIKKDGEFAYFAPDIAYNQQKYERGYDLIFTFLGADHLDHYPRILAAMRALGHDVKKWRYFIVQFFRMVKDGKIVRLSKRRGNVATPQDLIDEVGYDVARFFFLQHDLKSHMDFDLGLAKEQSEKNPVYYVQYARVRLQSILRRAKEEGALSEVGVKVELSSQPRLTHTAEVNLMRHMYRWPEVVAEITQTYAVHQLTHYAIELAKAVHVFYKHVPVLAAEDPKLIQDRLQLVVAANKVLEETLDLLGISKPDVM